MAASFPSSVKSFTTKVAGDTINAAHVNDLQDEVSAIETHLLSNSTTPRASVYSAATQSIPNATATELTFASEDYDVAGMHSTTSDTSRLTVPAGQGGLYLVSAFCYFGPVNNAFYLWITVDGNAVHGSRILGNGDGIADRSLGIATVLSLTAAQYVEAKVLHNHGGALNVGHATTAEVMNRLTAVRLY